MSTTARESSRVSSVTMAGEVSAARLAAVLIGLGTVVSVLVLATRTAVDGAGAESRPYVGHAIAVATIGLGLISVLLLLVAWVEAWRSANS